MLLTSMECIAQTAHLRYTIEVIHVCLCSIKERLAGLVKNSGPLALWSSILARWAFSNISFRSARSLARRLHSSARSPSAEAFVAIAAASVLARACVANNRHHVNRGGLELRRPQDHEPRNCHRVQVPLVWALSSMGLRVRLSVRRMHSRSECAAQALA
jgi:hypothetical protein